MAQVIDFTFVRAEVAQFYGDNGNEGVDPIILAQLRFLLFFDDVPSERELLASRPERLDYLWFLAAASRKAAPTFTRAHAVMTPCRLQTRDTADCKSALHPGRNRRVIRRAG